MRPILPITAALILGACSSMDTHRTACSQQLGLAAALAIKDSAETEPDPAVEACAQQRRAAEEQRIGQGIALGVAATVLAAAAVALGASSGATYQQASRYRPRSHYREVRRRMY